MSLIDWILVAVILLIVVIAVASLVKNRKKGGGCSCGCSGCANSGKCAPDNKK